jgi:hypothetical protein
MVKMLKCIIKYHVMKTYEEMGVQLYSFLISALEDDEWYASRPMGKEPLVLTVAPIG